MKRRNTDENGNFGHILAFNFRKKHFGRISKIVRNAGGAAHDIWKLDGMDANRESVDEYLEWRWRNEPSGRKRILVRGEASSVGEAALVPEHYPSCPCRASLRPSSESSRLIRRSRIRRRFLSVRRFLHGVVCPVDRVAGNRVHEFQRRIGVRCRDNDRPRAENGQIRVRLGAFARYWRARPFLQRFAHGHLMTGMSESAPQAEADPIDSCPP